MLSDNVFQSDMADEMVEKFYLNASGEIDSIRLMDAFNENYLLVKGSFSQQILTVLFRL